MAEQNEVAQTQQRECLITKSGRIAVDLTTFESCAGILPEDVDGLIIALLTAKAEAIRHPRRRRSSGGR